MWEKEIQNHSRWQHKIRARGVSSCSMLMNTQQRVNWAHIPIESIRRCLGNHEINASQPNWTASVTTKLLRFRHQLQELILKNPLHSTNKFIDLCDYFNFNEFMMMETNFIHNSQIRLLFVLLLFINICF